VTLDGAAVARLMARFEPFEPSPILAVGVSGGADSMALALLADAWAKARGGRLLALTVDHGLRAEAADEARQVAGWLSQRGIAHETLVWIGAKPATGIQAAARQARLALLGERCRAGGILHLLLAHHRGDQAETLALRREDRSGPDGLAAMAAETATPWGRVLRPLLGEPKSALTVFLGRAGQPWIEDPSNLDVRHARVRLRQRIADEASESALADTAGTHGRDRIARERAVADALARHVGFDAAGWARLAPALLDQPDDLFRAAIARVVVAIGNLDYPPRGDGLDRLVAHLKSGDRRARTLGGCRLLPRHESWLVVREPASLPPRASFIDGVAAWDRFIVKLGDGVGGHGLSLGPLGTDLPSGDPQKIPVAARPALPAIHDLDGVVAVPHLGWVRQGVEIKLEGATSWIFPRQALARAEFAVA
jgi:tRNA(Ile)-lysidine synthase